MAIAVGDVVTGLSGAYRIESRHGEGSFGITYRATDQKSGAHLIVKELRIEKLDDWKALELFEREGRVLASLAHANIPAFHDFFAHGAATALPVSAMSTYNGPEKLSLVLVQDFIDGATLQQRVEAGQRLSHEEARNVLRALLQALHYLHERTPPLVHRDIKPGNVILTPGGQPYLVDFGAIQDRLRSTGSVGSTIVGTLGYMPLEQIRGDARPASDLYALGVTMVVAMTATPLENLPFDDDTGQIAIQRAVAWDTPDELRQVLESMTAPLLGQRAHSAGELLPRIEPPRRIPPPERHPEPRPRPQPARHEYQQPKPQPWTGSESAPAPDDNIDEWEHPKKGLPIPVLIMGTCIAAFVVVVSIALIHRNAALQKQKTAAAMAASAARASASASAAAPPPIPSRPDDALSPPWALPAMAKTLKQYADGCRNGKAQSCYDLATVYAGSSSFNADRPRQADANRLGCDLGYMYDGKAVCCRQEAYAYNNGIGVVLDHAKSAAIYSHGCDLGDLGQCAELGRCLVYGDGVAVDVPGGTAKLEQTCRAGSAMGCGVLGWVYRDGKGVKVDFERAAGLFAKACDGDYKEACVPLGDLYATGRGVTRDRPRAISFYETACRAKVQKGCDAEAKLNMGPTPNASAIH